MTVLEGRGGFPHVFRDTIATSGRKHSFPFMSKYLQIRVATNACKMYFTEADYTADTNYILVAVPTAAEPHGWQGPVEANTVWLKAITAGSAVELVAYQRRG